MYMEKFGRSPAIEIRLPVTKTASATSERTAPSSAATRNSWRRPRSVHDRRPAGKDVQAAIAAGEAVNYEGVGTVEFLVDADRNFYFMR